MKKYKYWDIYEEMPKGWRIDKSSGSPLFRHVFIINGSVLKGGSRALLKIGKD